MPDTEEARRALMANDAAFRQLFESHHALDDRLKVLATKPHLTDDEQFQEVTLKKEKLRLKDQMEALLRRHQSGLQSSMSA
jgi:uncharacterized protein YdcH (DUF465 family)